MTLIRQIWEQPINPSGITATSGWENPMNAFDGSESTYARCNNLNDYIEYNLGENIYITAVNTMGRQINSQAVATNFKVYSVDSQGNETLLGTTTGSANTNPYYTSVTFTNDVLVNKLRFYITTTYSGAPSRTVYIKISGYKLVEGPTYKTLTETIRKYYKYVSWTQPVLTGYATSTDLGNITVSATSDFGGNCQAWKIMIGSVSSTIDNNYWQLANSNNQESLTLTFPYKLKISSLKITTRPSDNYTRNVSVYDSSGSQIGSTINCNAPITEYTILPNGDVVTNTLIITVLAGSNNSYFGLQNLQIVAQRIVEGTSSDYDFYEDIDEYKCIKKEIRTYYKEVTFNASSSIQSYTLPNNASSIEVDCVGAKGYSNGNTPGKGGRVKCTLATTPGQTLYFMVGDVPSSATAAYNASDIRTNNAGVTDSTSLNSRLVVAGGGGYSSNQANGGNGGGTTGAGGAGNGEAGGGGGGTQTTGGSGGGASGAGSRVNGNAGTFGLGGNYVSKGGNTGSGGAGWYGGGSGSGYQYFDAKRAGGGGGSSYADSTLCTSVTHTQGYRDGAGYIKIIHQSTESDYTYYTSSYQVQAFNI